MPGGGGQLVLEISLLGEQRVAVDGSVVMALRSPRAMALLGFLLVHRARRSAGSYIAAQFWPESTEAQARTNLRRELHALRAGLPQVDRWLAAEGGTLLWRLDRGLPAGRCRLRGRRRKAVGRARGGRRDRVPAGRGRRRAGRTAAS